MQDKIPEELILLVVSTAVILLLVLVVVFAAFINQKRKFSNLRKLQTLKSDFDREVLTTRLEVQQQTFETISRELHDNVGIILSMASVHLSTLSQELRPEDRAKATQASELVNEAMGTLRDVSHQLNPEWMEEMELEELLRKELTRIAGVGSFATTFTVDGTPFPVPGQNKIVLFRMAQEIMNNALKHSGAKTLDLYLHHHPDRLEIVIQDDGRGFEPGSAETGKGMGRKNLQARAAMIDAGIEWLTSPGEGTTCIIILSNQRKNPDMT